jgi:hypothetical protein
MGKELGGASRTERKAEAVIAPPAEAQGEMLNALELVAVRGTDVIGVRHLLEGGQAWVGQSPESIARVSMGEWGGHATVLAECVGGRFVLHVPPRARARMHGSDGLGRLAIGPVDIEVEEGDRTVVVMGQVQIRARIVPVEMSAPLSSRVPGEAKRWIAVMGALYITALALCAMIAPSRPSMLDSGLRRAVDSTLERTVAQVSTDPGGG